MIILINFFALACELNSHDKLIKFTVTDGSEFHAAIELGKNEFWNCSVWHWSGTIDIKKFMKFVHYYCGLPIILLACSLPLALTTWHCRSSCREEKI